MVTIVDFGAFLGHALKSPMALTELRTLASRNKIVQFLFQADPGQSPCRGTGTGAILKNFIIYQVCDKILFKVVWDTLQYFQG